MSAFSRPQYALFGRTVILHYAGGQTEAHPLINGVHLTDWAKGPDVPGWKNIGVAQVRYFSIVPKRKGQMITVIEVQKGTDQTSPFVIAVTIEPPKKDEDSKPPKHFMNSIGMKFAWIPPGSFMMGSPKEEKPLWKLSMLKA